MTPSAGKEGAQIPVVNKYNNACYTILTSCGFNNACSINKNASDIYKHLKRTLSIFLCYIPINDDIGNSRFVFSNLYHSLLSFKVLFSLTLQPAKISTGGNYVRKPYNSPTVLIRSNKTIVTSKVLT